MGSNGKPGSLTPRQRDVIAHVRAGLSNVEIADQLGISEDGVKAHLSRLFLRYGVTNRVALLAAVDDSLPHALDLTSLGELRAIQGRSRDRSDQFGLARPTNGSSDRLTIAREALAAVDIALDLVRDLPPETSGAVLEAVRRRVSAAVAALADLDGDASRTKVPHSV